MSNKSSFDFYCLWEELFNEDFKLAESREFKNDSASQSFTMSPSRWINMTNAKGFISKRLKYNEGYQEKIEWSVRRSLSKTNYRIHTDSIKENIVSKITDKQRQYVYASEADVINVALFGMTAKEWKDKNPSLDGNIRDYTDILHLVVLSNLEVLNASMIDNKISQKDRLEKLNQTAIKELTILVNDKNIIGIDKLDKKNDKLLENK